MHTMLHLYAHYFLAKDAKGTHLLLAVMKHNEISVFGITFDTKKALA